jgi:RimJ/RimL family protein N-acetyltransferase
MDYSLAWLREPDASPAVGDLLCGLIRDIRLILIHPDLGNAAKLAAITEQVDLLAPPPGPYSSGAQSAALIVALLARNPSPATLLFEELAGEQIRVDLADRVDRPLTAAERHELHVSPGSSGHHRIGRLRTVTSGLVVAEVTSLVIPWRLPNTVRTALGIPGPDDPMPCPSDLPLGKALADLGARREPLGARLVRDATGIMSDGCVVLELSARIWLGDVPVALASERVTAELCHRATGRLASSRLALSRDVAWAGLLPLAGSAGAGLGLGPAWVVGLLGIWWNVPMTMPVCSVVLPAIGLRIAAGPVELRGLTDDLIGRLCELAAKGTRAPGAPPFTPTPWTLAPPQEVPLLLAQAFWARRADFSAAKWTASLAAFADGELTGFVSLMAKDYLVTRTASTASWLGPEFHGRGIGTAIRRVLCAFAFDHLGAEYLTSDAYADNPASLRVSQKLGYTELARTRLARLGAPVTSVELILTSGRLVRYSHPLTVYGLEAFRHSIGLCAV